MKRALASFIAIVLVAGASSVFGDAGVSGDAWFSKGDYARAAAEYSARLRANPEDMAARLGLAVSLLQMKQYGRASAELSQAAAKAPTASLLFSLRKAAADQAVLKNQALAEPIVLGPVPAAPGTPGEARPVRPPDTSVQLLAELHAQHPKNAAIANLLGDARQLAGQGAEAEKAYIKAVELAPGWTKPRVGLAITLLDSDAAKAAGLLEEVVRQEPANAEARLWLGEAYTRLGRTGEAQKQFELAAQDPATRADALVRSANVMLRQNQVPEALQQFEAAEAADPQNLGAIVGTAQSNFYLNQPAEAELAMQKSQEAVQEASADTKATVYGAVGQIQNQVYDYEQSIVNLEKAAQLDPDIQQVYAHMADSFRARGDLAGQNGSNEERLQQDPNDKQALRFLVEGYAAAGDHRKEANVAARLARLEPESAWNWNMRQAEALWKQGEAERAMAKWMESANLAYPGRSERVAQSIRKLPGAEKYARAELAKRKNDKLAFHLLYALDRAAGNPELALTSLEKTIELDRQNPSLYGQKGYLLRALGRMNEAEEALEQQRGLMPVPPLKAPAAATEGR